MQGSDYTYERYNSVKVHAYLVLCSTGHTVVTMVSFSTMMVTSSFAVRS